MDQIGNQLNVIAQNSTQLVAILNRPEAFWNSQWFAALIGAITALIVTSIKDNISKYRNRMSEIYKYFSQSGHWFSTESILNEARIHMYGHTATSNGTTTVFPEKSINEKMVIELRKKCKYWSFPICRLRFLFWKYEKAIWKISDNNDHRTIINSKEYKEANDIYTKIQDLAYRKTGETMWTA